MYRYQIPKKTQQMLEKLQKNDTTLTSLTIYDKEICVDGLKRLGFVLRINSHLKRLSIYKETSFGIEGVTAGDEGAAALGEALKCNTTLTELEFWNTEITNAGATALGVGLQHNRFTALTKLILYNNFIRDQGAMALALALQHNTTLTLLNLGANNIGVDGASALGVALQHNTTLTSLNLERNNITDVGGVALVVARRSRITPMFIDFSENDISFDRVFNMASKTGEQHWSPSLHVGFPQMFHKSIMATLLCNRSTSTSPALPDHVWHLIFSFWQRKNYYINE
jgi:hypothetical protein